MQFYTAATEGLSESDTSNQRPKEARGSCGLALGGTAKALRCMESGWSLEAAVGATTERKGHDHSEREPGAAALWALKATPGALNFTVKRFEKRRHNLTRV